MWKTIAVTGATAAIIGGAGTAAVAATGTPTPPPVASVSSSASDTSNASTTNTAKAGAVRRLRRAVHATWVSENKRTKTFTTHDAIRGQVTAVSPTSITVQAADNVIETYVLNSATKVHTRAEKTPASISDINGGDPVWVVGTGTTTLTAARVIDTRK
jgi:hypothetical protein